MSAGFPGLGLSGLFALLSALGTPIVQVARRRQRGAGQTSMGSIFALSVAMAIAIVGIWDGLIRGVMLLGYRPSHHSRATAPSEFASVPVVLISLCILVAIVATAELALHVSKPRTTPTPPPIPFPGGTKDNDWAEPQGHQGHPAIANS
jgi:hypothetical protein